MEKGIGNFRQTEIRRLPINEKVVLEFIEQWNEQMRPILELRYNIKKEEVERERLEPMIELNKIVNLVNWYIEPYLPAIITENS